MGDTRFSHGLAYGRFGNFFARTDNLFAVGDATPDVTDGNLFFTNNTSNVTITHFDLTSRQGGGATISQQFEGKVITIVFLDNSTRLANAGQLSLATSDGLQGANSIVSLLYHNSAWIELHRSKNINNVVALAAADSLSGAAFSVRGRTLVTADSLTIRRFTDGEAGQQITVLAVGNSAATIIANSAAADAFTMASGGITSYTLAGSDTIAFVYSGARWWEVGTRTGIT